MNLGGIDFIVIGRTYRITPIQQPERSAAFDGAYLSRLPLAPPLILQFDCWNADGALVIPYDELPFIVCHLTLQTPDGTEATLVASDEGEVVAMLYGTLVATPAEMQDRDGAQGVYADNGVSRPEMAVRAMLMGVEGNRWIHAIPSRSTSLRMPPPAAVTELTRHFDAQNVIRFGLPRAEW